MLDRYVEQAFPGVYYNPDRWDTADGYLPFQIFELYADALWRMRAVERVNLNTAIRLAFAKPEAMTSSMAEAFPGRPYGT